MRKTPWFLAAINAAIALLLGAANYQARAGIEKVWPWLQPLAKFFEPDALKWVLVLSSIGVLIPLIERYLGGYEFQKARVQRVMDVMVSDLFDGSAKEHRCTLFRAVRGWRAWIVGMCRLPWQDERLLKFREVMTIRPWGLYLYAFVRPKRAINPRPSVAFRIYRHKDRDCDGVAGLVWQNDVHTIRNLPTFDPGALRYMKNVSEYGPDTQIARYATSANIKNAVQLRARDHYARHFHGTVIEDSGGVKWGILLLDSTSAQCPIPESKKAGDKGDLFDQRFRRYAEVLGSVLT